MSENIGAQQRWSESWRKCGFYTSWFFTRSPCLSADPTATVEIRLLVKWYARISGIQRLLRCHLDRVPVCYPRRSGSPIFSLFLPASHAFSSWCFLPSSLPYFHYHSPSLLNITLFQLVLHDVWSIQLCRMFMLKMLLFCEVFISYTFLSWYNSYDISKHCILVKYLTIVSFK